MGGTVSKQLVDYRGARTSAGRLGLGLGRVVREGHLRNSWGCGWERSRNTLEGRGQWTVLAKRGAGHKETSSKAQRWLPAWNQKMVTPVRGHWGIWGQGTLGLCYSIRRPGELKGTADYQLHLRKWLLHKLPGGRLCHFLHHVRMRPEDFNHFLSEWMKCPGGIPSRFLWCHQAPQNPKTKSHLESQLAHSVPSRLSDLPWADTIL